jgi:acetate---CoA ligase (ADP-forming)
MADGTIHGIVVILTPQAMTLPMETARAIAACADGRKPVLVSFMGGLDVKAARDELLLRNLPDYPSPERAVNALKAMWDHASWLARPPRIITRFPANRRRVKRIITRHQKTGRHQIGEEAAKGILRAYDFNVPKGGLAITGDEALELARQLGYPVAMKIASPDVIHKSDAGGVKLNLMNGEAVRDAFDLMMLRIRQRVPGARIEGVYIEQMCRRGREVILGMTRDPQFGPMLMFGIGGIFVEVMKDVTFNIAPITRDEATEMLESTKSYALLKGVRGLREVDLSAIAEALQRISQLVTEFPEIAELDINPFMVGEVGEASIAADARITIRDIGGADQHGNA